MAQEFWKRVNQAMNIQFLLEIDNDEVDSANRQY